MCLLANGCEQTATEDRTVYKIIWKDNCSEYQGFQYEAGGRYQLNKPLVLRPYADTLGSVHEGFHAFRSLETAVYNHAHRRQKKWLPSSFQKTLTMFWGSATTSYQMPLSPVRWRNYVLDDLSERTRDTRKGFDCLQAR